MGFKFSLQAVLEHRLTIEEKAQREYSEALGRLENLRRQCREIEADITRQVASIRILQARGLRFAERELYERWIVAQKDQARLLGEEIQRQQAVVEQQRLKLVKAVQDRTVMEKLRERELEVFRQEEAHAELRLFDEIAVRDFIKARRQEKDAELSERIAG